MRKSNFIWICIILFLGMGCSKKMVLTPLESDVNLKEVQLFTSEEIRIFMETEEVDAEVNSGKVKTIHSNTRKEWIIPKHTPCLVEKVNDDLIHAYFDGSKSIVIPFRKPRLYGNYYVLSPDRIDWGKSYVMMNGTEYRVRGNVKLLYRNHVISKKSNERKTINGVRLESDFWNIDSLGKEKGSKGKGKKGSRKRNGGNPGNTKPKQISKKQKGGKKPKKSGKKQSENKNGNDE